MEYNPSAQRIVFAWRGRRRGRFGVFLNQNRFRVHPTMGMTPLLIVLFVTQAQNAQEPLSKAVPPSVVSIPALAQKCVPTGDVIRVSPKLGDRYLVASLRPRRLGDLRSLLSKALSVTFAKRPDGTWWVAPDEVKSNADRVRAKQIVRDVQDSLNREVEKLQRALNFGSYDQFSASSQDGMAELRERAQRYSGAQSDRFLKNCRELIDQQIRYDAISNVPTWVGLVGAARSRCQAIQSRKTLNWTQPNSAFQEDCGLTPDDVKPVSVFFDLDRYGDGTVLTRQGFDWVTMSLQTSCSIMCVGGISTSDSGELLPPVSPALLRHLPPVESDTSLACLGRFEVSGTPIEPLKDVERTLPDALVAWAKATKEEVLSEVMPLTDMYCGLPPELAERPWTLKDLIAPYLQDSAVAAPPSPGLDSGNNGQLPVESVMIQQKQSQAEAEHQCTDRLYRNLSVSLEDGVWVVRNQGAFWQSQFPLPINAFVRGGIGGPLTVAKIRSYCRAISVPTNAAWASAIPFGGGASGASRYKQLCDAYPWLRAIELESKPAADEFWKTLLATDQAEIQLGPTSSADAWNTLAIRGDAFGYFNSKVGSPVSESVKISARLEKFSADGHPTMILSIVNPPEPAANFVPPFGMYLDLRRD